MLTDRLVVVRGDDMAIPRLADSPSCADGPIFACQRPTLSVLNCANLEKFNWLLCKFIVLRRAPSIFVSGFLQGFLKHPSDLFRPATASGSAP